MTNISWLKKLAISTHYDNSVEEILNSLPIDIQVAYRNNDHNTITSNLTNINCAPFKQEIFNL